MCYNYMVVFLLCATAASVNGKIKVVNSSDPGTCTKKNVGETLFVKNRNGMHKLLLCSQTKGKYLWAITDGSTPIGEFFSPGYDCSAILDKDPQAKDGFYWIHLNGKQPNQVWCDMTTDGGGFMLIARKNSSYTLGVPSNDNPVEPFGDPHWSSALGLAPIVDFRIQMADKPAFNKVKAHWYFRLNSPRKLSQLMIIKQGCSRSAPGIGDIAFVKDLIADKIVTRSFRCSRFGAGHHPRANIGWKKMNWCLTKPCAKGFAFIHTKYFVYQTDFSGAFSYSTTKRISGVGNAATAFLGCDNDKCCGCYGPTGGKNDYCFTKCQAKNGGKIMKSVFTWFWVRSSLPKRVWNKCIEYKITESGSTVWYKIKGGNPVPVKGRCAKDKALFYDGMLVVPDNVTARKVPSIEGMVVYRKDNQQLYVTKNKTLDQLAKENEVVDVKGLLAKLKKKLDAFTDDGLSISLILNKGSNYRNTLRKWLPFGSWGLCYRASQNGWSSNTFHSRCDSKGPTVTIIRVGVYVFGAYTDQSWGGSARYMASAVSFIFSLKNRYNLPAFKAPVYRYHQYGIYTSSSYGPTFGGGHDIYIVNNAGKSTSSYTNLGYTYKPPYNYGYGSSSTQALLAGSYTFRPSEIEVFFKR